MADGADRGFSTVAGLRVLLLLFGLGFCWLSFVAGRWSALTGSSLNAAQGILASVGASFIFALSLDLLLAVQRAARHRAFRAFFGGLTAEGDCLLIYPDFELNAEVLREASDIRDKSQYLKRSRRYPAVFIPSLPAVLAAVDVQAAIMAAAMLGEYTEKPARLQSDAVRFDQLNGSVISFGFYSNDVTWHYLETDREPMFEIGQDPNLKHYFRILVGGANEKFGWEIQHDHALLVKYRPEPKSAPDRVWILCAGLGVSGTAAVTYRFIRDWRSYFARFGNDDFAIVFTVSHSEHAYESARELKTFLRRTEPGLFIRRYQSA